APLQPGPGTGAARAAVREVSAFLDEDRSLAPDIAAARKLVAEGTLSDAAEAAIGPLE
ncbi:MAG: hypothetical protein QOC87_819, partial [Actinomycetota bacterium]|nr:hypothetical protein [Actinomycetota bacterium]